MLRAHQHRAVRAGISRGTADGRRQANTSIQTAAGEAKRQWRPQALSRHAVAAATVVTDVVFPTPGMEYGCHMACS